MQPNITVMVAFKNQKNLPISSIKFNDDMLAWAANENSKKRFKSNTNLWTLQATLNWSKKTINKYKTDKSVMEKLINRFVQLSGFEKRRLFLKKHMAGSILITTRKLLILVYGIKNII